ncbi:hypothetical protein [Thiocapsa marina]|uniref:Uncharacterized protein n=1 Tax=Thiocapsa marina 5811 TaxID=768671 RepID=F9UHW0_9GAMM|nr:hypothetical protein [Thiocapsa marina]EGV16136.1 hypothetical protein ThimaDRAFT_4513 [Thiocapsa marina 5811]
MSRSVLLALGLTLLPAAQACDTTWDITLVTFGEGVSIELRAGSPGTSRVLATRQSSGGHVVFSNLCAGDYFLAIGNNETVNVTPVRTFEDGADYQSRITVQTGSGNVSTRSRSSL